MLSLRILFFTITIALPLVINSKITREEAVPRYSFNDVWDYYGFTRPEQKTALWSLFEQASIGNDINSSAHNQKEPQLAHKLEKLITELQIRFALRSGTQERWEIKPLDWMSSGQDAIKEQIRTLGFIDALFPKTEHADTICILGGARERMQKRIEFSELLLEKGVPIKTIILLTGERHVTCGVDGTEEELQEIAQTQGLTHWSKLTETALFEHLYKKSAIAEKTQLEKYTIDTPAGDLPRPTTQTTMIKLISWLKEHPDIRHILFVSNQPYIRYQHAIIQRIFENEQADIAFETVGPAADKTDTVHKLLEGVGSYLQSTMSSIVKKMGIATTPASSS